MQCGSTGLFTFAACSALLYSSLLPLWEGFDEPFHFGYVQSLASGFGLPDRRNAYLSEEVAASLAVTPASAIVRRNLRMAPSYEQYFAFPSSHRMPAPGNRRTPSKIRNYEAHQAPLAYAILAPAELALASIPLPKRVLCLRILAALCGSLLLYMGMRRLCDEVHLPGPYADAAAFCLLSSQMTWGTIAHVANDWLALPLTIWLLSALIRYSRLPTPQNAVCLGLLLAASLLTKAYALAFLPLVACVVFAARRARGGAIVLVATAALAGPWYVRNLMNYAVLSGIPEAQGWGGISVLQIAAALDWADILIRNARWMLWTGNNTFLSFSERTLNVVLGVWTVGLLLWALQRKRSTSEWIIAGHSASFLLALAHITVLSAVYTRGLADGPSPWYSQVLVTPLLVLAILGCSRSRRAGAVCAAALVLLFGYLHTLTYAAKLLPLYAGWGGPIRFASTFDLTCNQVTAALARLDTVTLGPLPLVLGLTIAVTGMALAQAVRIVIAILRSHPTRPSK